MCRSLPCKTPEELRKRMRSTWWAMILRCENPRDTNYKNYGGRGISVCSRWRSSFDDFCADMGPRPDGLSIDRIDVNGNYEPSNCRWADTKRQLRNQRRTVYLELDGLRMSVPDWCDKTGLSYRTIEKRLARGWDARRTLTTPHQGRDRPTCRRGHPRIPENINTREGRQRCRVCKREYDAKREGKR